MSSFWDGAARAGRELCDPERARRLAALLSGGLLAFSAWLAFAYRDQALLGMHGFRQTQTAVTAYWACRGGFGFAYWTPIAGPPWSIPFEFPLFQWLVALVACPFGLALDPVGRLVSYGFWIACLVPARAIFRTLLGPSASLHFWLFAALFLSMPLYLFWGRAFLIETTALFLALNFVLFSLRLSLDESRWRDAVLAGSFLLLALLQKSTTALPLLVLAGIDLRRRLPELRAGGWWRSWLVWQRAVAYVLPLAIGAAWAGYADVVKRTSALGTALTSSALMRWNFGTLAARFSQNLWIDVIWNRVITENVAGHLGVFVILAALAYAPQRRALIIWGVALFLVYFMVFENLFFVHHYYVVANGVYLCFALAVAFGGLIESRPGLSAPLVVALLIVIEMNLSFFLGGYLFADESRRFDERDPVLTAAAFAREHTQPSEPLLVYGDDWNSELPYYAERRALLVPAFFRGYFDPLDRPQRYLAQMPGALMICRGARFNPVVTTKVLALYAAWSKNVLELCDVYLEPPGKGPRILSR
jgi:hypothetical protein